VTSPKARKLGLQLHRPAAPRSTPPDPVRFRGSVPGLAPAPAASCPSPCTAQIQRAGRGPFDAQAARAARADRRRRSSCTPPADLHLAGAAQLDRFQLTRRATTRALGRSDRPNALAHGGTHGRHQMQRVTALRPSAHTPRRQLQRRAAVGLQLKVKSAIELQLAEGRQWLAWSMSGAAGGGRSGP